MKIRFWKRGISSLLTVVMLLSAVQLPVFAAEETAPIYLAQEELDASILESGAFYLASSNAQIEENSNNSYLVKVARGGENLPESELRLNILDITAKYGEDYTIRLYNGSSSDGKVENPSGNKSVLEEILENSDAIQEENYTDGLVSENDMTMEEASELYDKDVADMQAYLENGLKEKVDSDVVLDVEKANDPFAEQAEETAAPEEQAEPENTDVPEETTAPAETATPADISTPEKTPAAEDNSISEAVETEKKPASLKDFRELATGLESDRQPMDGGNMLEQYTKEMLSDLSAELESAYLVLSFAEGETEKYIEIIPKDNSAGDGDRVFTATLFAVSENAAVSSAAGINVTIVDDEVQEPASISFGESQYYPTDGFIRVSVVREGAINQMVTAKLTTSDGSAVGSRDYSPVDTTVAFPYGVTERSVNIPVRSDYLKEDASFSITLSDPVNASLGSVCTAEGVIPAGSQSFVMNEAQIAQANALAEEESAAAMPKAARAADAGVNTIFTGPNIDLTKAYSTGDDYDGYSRADGDKWIMQAKENFYDYDRAWAHWSLGENRYDYSGWQIKWSRSGGGGAGRCRAYFEALNHNTNNWDAIYSSSHKNDWTDDVDNYFLDSDKLRECRVEIQGGGLANKRVDLTIHYIKPIKRPFEVSLKGAEPLTFLDANGNPVKNTSLPGDLSRANETLLEGANETGKGTAVKFTGDQISVKIDNPYAYISALRIVHPSNGTSRVIQYYGEGTTNAAFQLDNNLIKNNLDYVEFAKNGDKGKKGKFLIQPVLDYYDTKVTVHSDTRGDVSIHTNGGQEEEKTNSHNIYRIKNVNSGLYLYWDVPWFSSNVVSQKTYKEGDKNQEWLLIKNDDGTYHIHNSAGSHYISINNGSLFSKKNKDKVELTRRPFKSKGPEYTLKDLGDGKYAIMTDENRCIEVTDGSKEEDAKLKRADYAEGATRQQWILEFVREETEEKPEKSTHSYHRGDTIRLYQNLKEEYQSTYTDSRIKIKTKENSGQAFKDALYAYDKGANQPCYTFKNVYSEIEVYPNFDKNDNQIVVRVSKEDAGKFAQDKGIFKEYANKVETTNYIDYVLWDKGACKEGTYYEFSAYAKEQGNIAVWKPATAAASYTQETFYYEAKNEAEENVLTLSCEKADAQPYVLSGKSFYGNVPLNSNNESTAWIPADGVYLNIGRFYGLSDDKGKLNTMGFYGQNGKSVIYKVSASGREEYKTVTLSNKKTTTFDNGGVALKAYDVSLGDMKVPAQNLSGVNVTSFVPMNMNGVSGNTMSINDSITSYMISIANNGLAYLDSDGVERTEKVKSVNLLIYDGQSNQLKTTIEGAKEASNANGLSVWNGAKTFEHGKHAEYAAGDKAYIQITTDRVVGNGKGTDADGNEVEAEILKETVYAPVYTGVTLTEANQKEPVTHDIDAATDMDFVKLPLIGTMNATFNIKQVSLTISELPNGGQRLSVGFIYKTEEEKEAGDKADDGVNYGLTDFKAAASGIKAFGEGVKAAGKSTMFMPSWGVYPIFGVYLDFGVKNVYYTENVGKKLVFIGGGLYLGMTGNFRLVQYFIVGWMPFYLGVEGELTLFNQAGIHVLDENTATSDKILNEENSFQDGLMPDWCIQANAVVKAYAGMGLCGTLGVRGGIQLDGNYIYNPTIQYRYPDYHENGLYLSADVKVWVDAVMFSIPIPAYHIADARYGYYEDVANGNAGEFPVPWKSSARKTSNDSQVFMKERTSKDSEWVGENGGITLFSTFEEDTSKPIMNNSYDRADSQLLDLGDGRILLAFLADEKTRSDEERTVLKYSIYDGVNWSEPVIVQNDGAADFEPNLCDAGDKVLISWTSRALEDTYTNETEYLRSLDVYAVTLDKTMLTLGTIERLSEDRFYDSAPVGLYDDASGDMLVYYLKSEVKDQDGFENAVSPYKNESVIVYMLYDASQNQWARTYYYDNEIDNPDDEEILVEQFGGQRFLSSAIEGFAPDGSTINDPAITDFDAISYNSLGLYAFTVDADNNMDTDGDRELFVQVYDFKEHMTFKPIRVTKDNVTDARPQLVRNGDHTYLFWLQNNADIRYIDVSDLIKNGIHNDGTIKPDYDLDIGAVFFIQTEGADINPTFGSYQAFVDKDDNLFITWLQPVENEDGSGAQEIYASALVRNDPAKIVYAETASEEEIEAARSKAGTSWSDGVRLTNSGRFNDEVAMVAYGDGKLLTVSNQYDMDISKEKNAVENPQLVATTYKTVGSLEVSSIELSNDTPKADEIVNVTVNVKNTGLKPAKGYKVEVYEKKNGTVGKQLFTDDIASALTPSSTDPLSFDWEMPETYEELSGLSLYVKIYENEMAEVVEHDGGAIEVKPVYQVKDYSIKEENDGFHIDYVVGNIGNKGADNGDRVVVEFNDLYRKGTGKTYYLDQPIGAIGIGEEVGETAYLNIPDEHFKYGYTNAYIEVQDKDGNTVSNTETFEIGLDFPYQIVLNGDEDITEINLKPGQSMELNATYAPNEFYSGGVISYSVADGNIASIDENKITGLSEGTTTLEMMVVPYGGYKTVVVNVGKKNTGGSIGGGGGGAASYTITFDSVGGSKVDSVRVNRNETVSKPADPTREGYTFDGWYADKECTKAYDFSTKVTNSFTLYAKWTKKEAEPWKNPFTDVKDTDWFYGDVQYVHENNLFAGISDTEFGPNHPMTRAMLVTVLYRAEGEPSLEDEILGYPFADVDAESWYGDAVYWARLHGIVKGYSDEEFAPDQEISREQIAAIMQRYADFKGVAADEKGDLSKFTDVSEISDWARGNMEWAVGTGLISGRDNGMVDPLGNASRAEVAAILHRYLTKNNQ